MPESKEKRRDQQSLPPHHRFGLGFPLSVNFNTRHATTAKKTMLTSIAVKCSLIECSEMPPDRERGECGNADARMEGRPPSVSGIKVADREHDARDHGVHKERPYRFVIQCSSEPQMRIVRRE